MKNSKLYTFLSYLSVVGLFAIVSLFYFAPQMKGKVLKMHDIVQYEGMCQDIVEHKADYNEDPQWAGRMFGGMPSYLINFSHDGLLVRELDEALGGWWRPASLIFLAMFGFWLMLLMWGVNPWLGAISALAYGLSTYSIIIIGAGHITKAVAIAYAPMMIGAVFYTLRRNMWIGAALTALFASVEIYANHFQIAYYFIFILIALWINEGVRAYKGDLFKGFTKATLLLALAGVVAIGANLSNIWYVQQHAGVTMRGGSELTSEQGQGSRDSGLSLDYATAWSYGKSESLNMLIPSFMGGSSSGGFSRDGEVADALMPYGQRTLATQLSAYWGEQPGTAGPTYLGAVMLFLAIFALFMLARRETIWIAVVSVLSIFLAWGSNMMWFTELFFNYVPLYNKFRAVATILVIVQWSVPFLAALGLAKLWSGENSKQNIVDALKKSIYIVGGITLAMIILGGSLFDFSSLQYDNSMPQDIAIAMRAERLSMMQSDAWRSLVLVLLTATTLWLYVSGKVKKMLFVLLLLGLTLVDMIPIGMRFLSHDKFVEPTEIAIKPTAANLAILEDETPGYRVANFAVSTFNDATTSYFHRSIGGYHGAKLRRYQDIVDKYLVPMDMQVYSMLNTKYFITSDDTGKLSVVPNESAFGAAWFVREVKVVGNPDEEIAALSGVDLRNVAVVDERFTEMVEGVNLQVDSTANIELVDYKVNHLSYKTTSKEEGIVVFSEIYYDKGWSSWIDGVEVPYFRTDYILRGLVVPAGEHLVEFKFSAPNFEVISVITLICSLIAMLGALGSCIWLILDKKNINNEK